MTRLLPHPHCRPCDEPASFYVTAIRSSRQVSYLAGPFLTHQEALDAVDAVRRLACEMDPWCDFDLFGIASVAMNRPGVLNDRLRLSEAA